MTEVKIKQHNAAGYSVVVKGDIILEEATIIADAFKERFNCQQ